MRKTTVSGGVCTDNNYTLNCSTFLHPEGTFTEIVFRVGKALHPEKDTRVAAKSAFVADT